jgi:hypothetical protein
MSLPYPPEFLEDLPQHALDAWADHVNRTTKMHENGMVTKLGVGSDAQMVLTARAAADTLALGKHLHFFDGFLSSPDYKLTGGGK